MRELMRGERDDVSGRGPAVGGGLAQLLGGPGLQAAPPGRPEGRWRGGAGLERAASPPGRQGKEQRLPKGEGRKEGGARRGPGLTR